ncbi:glycosyltransferase family 2 protein [Agreia sp. COWG]|uniref:glycosyltransferase family 2 protein n=1 Tax=Agreia sp. COWG TaxID=2773266 RepID=UPI001AFAA2AE|nr:glycosyltransferase family 2 protein [Agreia sp. COWG]CAD5991196.1 Glycosyltransferase, GT2 family [Agreia sp. COWG]
MQMSALDNSQPITVIVPYYRGSAFLDGLRDSLADQSAREVIIVVDGGEELELVETHLAQLQGLRVLTTREALGTAGARNFGARYATQDWITFLDQDDHWPPGFLKDLFCQVSTDVLAYDNDLFEEKTGHPRRDLKKSVFEEAGWSKSRLSRYDSADLLSGFPMVKLLLTKVSFQSVGGYRESVFAVEDFDLVWRLIASGNELTFVTQPRGSYTVRPDSITGRIAAGDPGSTLKALRSWASIWTRMTLTSSLPLFTRAGAARRALRTYGRIAKNRLKRFRVFRPRS